MSPFLIDPNTAVSLMAVACFIVGALLVGLSRAIREYRILGEWGWATLLQCAGWLIMGTLRPVLPELVSIVVGQSTIGIALALWMRTLYRFVGAEYRWRIPAAILVVEAVSLVFFTAIDPNPVKRQMILPLCRGLLLIGGPIVLLHDDRGSSSQRLVAVMLIAAVLVFSARALTFAFFPWLANATPFEVHPFTTISYILLFGLSIVLP